MLSLINAFAKIGESVSRTARQNPISDANSNAIEAASAYVQGVYSCGSCLDIKAKTKPLSSQITIPKFVNRLFLKSFYVILKDIYIYICVYIIKKINYFFSFF